MPTLDDPGVSHVRVYNKVDELYSIRHYCCRCSTFAVQSLVGGVYLARAT